MSSEERSSLQCTLPDSDAAWSKNNCKDWPHLVYEDLVDYLILSKAYDGKEMRAFRALWGHNYVTSSWIRDIFHINIDDNIFFKSCVSPSQPGVGKSDYDAWLCLRKDSGDSYKILTAGCTCPAGLGRACSHVSAIAYAIVMAWSQGLAGSSCTDIPVTWGKGASASKSDHQEILKKINFSRPSQNKPLLQEHPHDGNPQKEFRFRHFGSHSDLQEFVKSSPLVKLWDCKGTLACKTLAAPPVTTSNTVTDSVTHGNHDLNYSHPLKKLECNACDQFYQRYVNISDTKIEALCENTGLQNSSLWSDSRLVRIPASKLKNVPKTARANPENFINEHLHTRFKGSSATLHGNISEPIARAQFETEHMCKVNRCGSFISKSEPFLSASPDGIIDDDILLEIKCPTKSLSDLVQSNYYDIIQSETGYTVNPKGRNGYFYQIQSQMFCAEKKLCKFYVWTDGGRDCVCVDVPNDEQFIQEHLPRLRAFYFKHLLVRIVDEFKQNRLKLSSEYLKFCTDSI